MQNQMLTPLPGRISVGISKRFELVKRASRTGITRAAAASGNGSAKIRQAAFYMFDFDGNLTITAQAQ